MDHLHYDRRQLRNYRRWALPGLSQGVGGLAFILGSGDFEVDVVLTDGTSRRETIFDVHHIPMAPCVLLSTEKLRLRGVYYSSEEQILYRKDGDARVEFASVSAESGSPLLRTTKQVKTKSDDTEKPDFSVLGHLWNKFWKRWTSPSPTT